VRKNGKEDDEETIMIKAIAGLREKEAKPGYDIGTIK